MDHAAIAIIGHTNHGYATSSLFVVCIACGGSGGVLMVTKCSASIISCRGQHHPERLCDYDNLVYACCQCNALKQEATPVLNPCEEALGQHLEIHSDGSVRALTARGAEQIALCRLNRPRLQEARRMMLELFSMLTASRSEEARVLLRGLCGFPDNRRT